MSVEPPAPLVKVVRTTLLQRVIESFMLRVEMLTVCAY